MASQRASTTLVKRGLFEELWSSLTAALFVRHEWPIATGDSGDSADTVGYAFSDAVPSRAVLLDVSGLLWFWCANIVFERRRGLHLDSPHTQAVRCAALRRCRRNPCRMDTEQNT
jgi:hypothetical protein